MDINDYPWSVLQLEPTDDKRAIKKSYAKKLKVTKPSDDAAAFQNLNEAYKYACSIAGNFDAYSQDYNDAYGAGEQYDKGSNDSEVDDQPIELPEGFEEIIDLSDVDHDDGYASIDNDQFENSYENHPVMIDLIEQLVTILGNDFDVHQFDKWQFLFAHEEIFDDDFCQHLAAEVLLRVAAHNVNYEGNRTRHKRVNKGVLEQLDARFLWRQNIHHYMPLVQSMAILKTLSVINGAEEYPDFYWLCEQNNFAVPQAFIPVESEEEEEGSNWFSLIYYSIFVIWILSKIFGGD